MTHTSYDYIIIGAGSAGCVLASRLSEDPDIRVLLLEAGGRDRHLWLRVPLRFQALKTDARFNWGFDTIPERHLGDRSIHLPRGRVLGGSSSTNGMIYCRAHPSDYDHWRQLGLTGWGYDDVLPYFKRSEAYEDGASAFHGGDGPLAVSKGDRASAIHRAHLAAGVAAGHPVTADHNGAEPEGFGPADFTIRRGYRASAARMFLHPARHRPNLTVATGALAQRILFERRRATGVVYRQAGPEVTARAGREVIVSAGTYKSPQLLMLSGVGPADHLRRHGIAILRDAAAVGGNLQDHVHARVGYASRSQFSSDGHLRADRFAVAVLTWMLSGKGLLGEMPVASVAYLRTRPELSRPDIEMLMADMPLDARIWCPGIRRSRGGFLGCLVAVLHPESRGTVTLASARADDKPVIHHNFLSAPNDLATLRRAITAARDVYAREPLAGMVRDELFPGREVRSEAEVDAYIRATADTLYHPVGTCRMGADPASVVDGELRVNGVDGLRVVDASVMPSIPGGHTNAPTIMIAEKAADMIRGVSQV